MTNSQPIATACLACSPAELCGNCARRRSAAKSSVGRVGRLQFVVVKDKPEHNNMHFGVRPNAASSDFAGAPSRMRSGLSTEPCCNSTSEPGDSVIQLPDDAEKLLAPDIEFNTNIELNTKYFGDLNARSFDKLSIEQRHLPDLVSSVFQLDLAARGYKCIELVAITQSSLIVRASADWLCGDVALKFFRPSLFDSRFARRIFEQEAAVFENINHPAIAPLFQYGIASSGVPFVITQFVPGITLSDLNSRRVQIEPASLFIQICEGLAFAHSQNILHGRLSASKIIASPVRQDSFVFKIIDFSVCSALRLQLPFSFESLRCSASPEERYGQDPDFRSDIYSLGYIMYETLTGSKPEFNRCNKVIGFPHLRGAAKILEPLVLRCLASEPLERYQCAGDLLKDLRSLESQLDVAC
ncbi:MAG: serine/threonine protein kinase [Cyanobacteria bacterium SZAS LIN-5]|nr:serine/threonine protein kinase [Cyanobacteria bacterium SZAS LIN-5]